jgi:hypothetical protein
MIQQMYTVHTTQLTVIDYVSLYIQESHCKHYRLHFPLATCGTCSKTSIESFECCMICGEVCQKPVHNLRTPVHNLRTPVHKLNPCPQTDENPLSTIREPPCPQHDNPLHNPSQCPYAAPHQYEPRYCAQLNSGISATEEHKLTQRRRHIQNEAD